MDKINAHEIQEITSKNNVVVVDYFATWCGPCQNYMKILDRVKVDEATIVKLDIDENPEHVQELNISSVPTLRFFKNGEEVKRQSGVMRQHEIEDTLRELLAA